MSEENYILKILENFDEVINTTAQEILSELKGDCKTYKEVQKKIKLLNKNIIWTYGLEGKYKYLIDQVQELLNKEMNDLPLTNRS